jgi:hypothetical protein
MNRFDSSKKSVGLKWQSAEFYRYEKAFNSIA